MPDYRRSFIDDGTYFFTHVTRNRRPLLCLPVVRNALKTAFESVRQKHPFTTNAMVLLPDHFHCIWTLLDDDHDYPLRWRLIKSFVTKRVPWSLIESKPTDFPKYGGLWQQRYWEHTIRDETDYWNHVHYIHFNPVKHGFVSEPSEWEFSTFRKFVQKGVYDLKWGVGEGPDFPSGIGGE